MSDLIHTAVFELETLSRPQGLALQQQVSEFAETGLRRVLSDCLHDFACDSALFRFDRVVLELGQLDESRFETQLAERIHATLMDFLRNNLILAAAPARANASTRPPPGVDNQADNPAQNHAADNRSSDSPDAETAAQAQQRALLDFFAGSIAATQDAIQTAEHLMREAIANQPLQLLRLIRQQGVNHAFRQRLARYLPIVLLEQLVRMLTPHDAALVIDYARDVQLAHQHRAIIAADSAEFGSELWEFILTFLLLERGSWFNTKTLAEYTLRKIASRHRMVYAQLLARLIECVQTLALPLSRRNSLPQVLLALHQESAPDELENTPLLGAPLSGLGLLNPNALSLTGQQLAGIGRFLETGDLPWIAHQGKRLAFVELMEHAMQTDPESLTLLLRRLGRQQRVRLRLANQLPDGLMQQAVQLLEPQQGNWINRAVSEMRKVQQQKNLIQEDRSRFARVLWEFVLHSLIVERGSYFNTRAFVKSLLQQMAAHYDITYQALLLGLIAYALSEQQPLAQQDALPGILLSLKQELLTQLADADAANRVLPRTAASGNPLAQAMHEFGRRARHIERGSHFNNRSFIQSLLRQLSKRHGIDYPTLLQALAAPDASTTAPAPAGSVPAILSTLKEEAADAAAADAAAAGDAIANNGPAGVPASPGADAAAQAALVLDGARHFLQFGTIPDAARQLPANLLRSLLQMEVLLQQPDQLLALLKDERERDAMILRMLQYFPASRLQTLLPLLAPNYGGFLHTWLLAGKALAQDTDLNAGQRSRVQQLQWQVLLQFLLAHQGRDFSLSDFLAESGRLLARALALPDWRARMLLLARDQAPAQPRYQPLVDLLENVTPIAPENMAPAVAENAPSTIRASNSTATDPASEPAAVDWQMLTLRVGSPDHDDALFSQLQYWLQYGNLDDLPSHANPGDPSGAPPAQEAALMSRLAQALHQPGNALRALLLRAAGREPERLRMVLLMPLALREQILQVLLQQDHESANWWRAALVRAMRALAPTTSLRRWEDLFAEELFRQLHQAHGKRIDFAVYLKAVIQRLVQQRFGLPALLPHLSQQLLRHLQAALAQHTPPQKDRVQSVIERVGRELQSDGPAQAAPKGAVATTAAKPGAARNSDSRARAIPRWPEKRSEAMPQESAIFVENAGQVILWPYLERYFRMLGLLEGKRFVGVAQQCRAVHLLQYLCTGSIEAPEHELQLNKVLCGMALDAVLEVAGPPLATEQQMTEQVLKVVTQHWDKLKNTSIDGLRETFLVRQGKLVQLENAWSLTVERKAFDVLMSTLPWGLSMIRLPWMEQMLQVKWN
jgi:hypothetical protein